MDGSEAQKLIPERLRLSSPFGHWFGHTFRVGALGVNRNGKLKDEAGEGRWLPTPRERRINVQRRQGLPFREGEVAIYSTRSHLISNSHIPTRSRYHDSARAP